MPVLSMTHPAPLSPMWIAATIVESVFSNTVAAKIPMRSPFSLVTTLAITNMGSPVDFETRGSLIECSSPFSMIALR